MADDSLIKRSKAVEGNGGLQPTLKQRVLASDRLPHLIMSSLSLLFTIWIVTTLNLNFAIMMSLWNCLLLTSIIVLSFISGWLGAQIITWLALSPILMAQSRLNGGPFSVGDHVQIISGKHCGQISNIYSKWQHDTNRVELGTDAKENYLDIYADYQLLRIDGDNQPIDTALTKAGPQSL